MYAVKNITVLKLIFLVKFGLLAGHVNNDTLTRSQYIHSQTIKSDSLNQLALKLAAPGASRQDLDEAIKLIMKGLHNYSRFRDSAGLRQTFDNLAYVYLLQKKMVQAKWFYIQSNSMSRDMHDTTGIIHSLVALSGVKTLIKDYSMAIRDLREAAVLAKTRKGFAPIITVQTAFADYYSRKGDFVKARLANDTIAILKDSVPKVDTPAMQPKSKPLTIKQYHAPQQVENNHPVVFTLILSGVCIILLLFIFLLYKNKRS